MALPPRGRPLPPRRAVLRRADLRPHAPRQARPQLRAHQKTTRKQTDNRQRQLRDQIADLDRRIGLQITALERGIEPDLIGHRIAELRKAKEDAEIELRALTPAAVDSGPDEDPAALLGRIPNLAHALQQAPPEVKRQVFDAFGLQVTYDKTARRIEISATITVAIAEALHNAEDLPEEVSSVAHRDIAGAGFEPATFGL
jgi:hypothetical protein